MQMQVAQPNADVGGTAQCRCRWPKLMQMTVAQLNTDVSGPAQCSLWAGLQYNDGWVVMWCPHFQKTLQHEISLYSFITVHQD